MDKAIKVLNHVMILLCLSCGRANKSSITTSNYETINDNLYSSDSTEILCQLRAKLKNRKGEFSSKEYFDSTKIYIDTIFYSLKHDKFAVFVIIKNPSYRQLLPDKRSKWYFNGSCYLGMRNSKDSIWINPAGPKLTNSINKEDLKSDMHEVYLTAFASFKNEKGESRYKYNLGDDRFWESPIWDELEMRRIRKEEFEKEKKKNPNNIYEPKYHD